MNVLTGDKLETAINIAKSCKLIDTKTLLNIINLTNNKIDDSEEDKMKRHNKYQELLDTIETNLRENSNTCIVITGESYK